MSQQAIKAHGTVVRARYCLCKALKALDVGSTRGGTLSRMFGAPLLKQAGNPAADRIQQHGALVRP